MTGFLDAFVKSRSGVTSVEYALAGAMLATIIVVCMTLVTGGLTSTFTTVARAFSGAESPE